MFSGSLMEEVKALEEDIEAVKAKVDDPMICEKVRLFVNAPREIQQIYKADAGTRIPVLLLLACSVLDWKFLGERMCLWSSSDRLHVLVLPFFMVD